MTPMSKAILDNMPDGWTGYYFFMGIPAVRDCVKHQSENALRNLVFDNLEWLAREGYVEEGWDGWRRVWRKATRTKNAQDEGSA